VLRSILVPLDGSRFAEQALPLATALARAAGAHLRLAAVHEPRPDLARSPGQADLQAQDRAVRDATRTYLRDTAAGLAGLDTATRLLEGIPGPALAAALEHEPPDLVVMSTHGRGPLSRFWLGSVADHLLRHSPVPLLLVRPPAEGAAPAAIRRILVALDLSDASRRVLDVAAGVARILDAELVLLHVVAPAAGMVDGALPFPLPSPEGALARRHQEAEARLSEVAAGLATSGARVATRAVVGVGVAATILEQAAEQGIDLVAMTTHGEGGVRRLLLGSVADKVIRGAEVPVLALRAPA
jgi:nucleotide-binding universal stress UspA family protein